MPRKLSRSTPLILVVALAAGLAVLLPTARATAEDGTDQLFNELARLEIAPCSTALVFQRLIGTWYITCEDCAAIPADRVYPDAVLEEVERWAVRGSLSFADLMALYGDCP